MTEERGRIRAVVTGANRGIGREVVRQFLREGFAVVMTGRHPEALSREGEALRAEGPPGELYLHALDVTDTERVESFAAWVDAELSGLDVLVNNAGVFLDRDVSLFDLDDERFRRSLDVNAHGALRLMRAFVPGMKRRGHGRVVNVSSQYASFAKADATCAAYRASKVALNMLTRVAAIEAGPAVKINAVHPGWVRTDMGGERAPRTVVDAAREILHLATLPDDGPSGGFFAEGRPHPW